MNYDEFYKEIKGIAEGLMRIYELKYEIMKPEVMDIINNRSKNKKRIEACLDETLDIPTDKGFELHSLLCSYYYLIDRKSALFYMNSYNEFWNDEEDDLGWKHIKK